MGFRSHTGRHFASSTCYAKHTHTHTHRYHSTQGAIGTQVQCKISFIATRHQILKAIHSALCFGKELEWTASVVVVLRPEIF